MNKQAHKPLWRQALGEKEGAWGLLLRRALSSTVLFLHLFLAILQISWFPPFFLPSHALFAPPSVPPSPATWTLPGFPTQLSRGAGARARPYSPFPNSGDTETSDRDSNAKRTCQPTALAPLPRLRALC